MRYVGGLVGVNADDEDLQNKIDRSIATANVIGTDHTGGLVGLSHSWISDSYASGAVQGTSGDIGGWSGETGEPRDK